MSNMSTATASTQHGSSSKLRNSCDSCSLAKVGCGKEKPICGRCAKRQLPCVYGATKRAGRTSHSKQLQQQQQQLQQQQQQQQHQQQQHAANQAIQIASMPMIPEPTSTSSQILDPLPIPTLTPTVNAFPLAVPDLSHFGNQSFSPTYSDIFATLVQPSMPSAPTPITGSTDLDELMASVVSPLPVDVPEFDMSADPVFDFGSIEDFIAPNNSSLVPLPDNSYNAADLNARLTRNSSSDSSLFPPTTQPIQPVAPLTPRSASISTQGSVAGCHTPGLTAMGLFPRIASFPFGDQCTCLRQALNLLAQHSIPTRPQSSAQASNSEPPPRYELPEFDRLVELNEQTIEEVDNILKCSCACDGYLLVILSMVVFAVLSWYTAAACSMIYGDQSAQQLAPVLRRRPESSSMQTGVDCEAEDQNRLDAQTVLAKLHGVQRVANMLSNRVQSYSEDPTIRDVSGETAAQKLDWLMRSPFSVTLLKAMESDMRRRLRELSRAIVLRLRQGW